MKKLPNRITMFALTAVLVSAAAWAQQGPGPGGRGPQGQKPAEGVQAPNRAGGGGALMHCLGVIDLTEEQKTQVQGILEAARPTMEALHDQMQTDRAALKALTDADSPNACDVGAALLKVNADRDAINTQREAIKASVDAILTAEQKAKLEGCLAGSRGRRGRPSED